VLQYGARVFPVTIRVIAEKKLSPAAAKLRLLKSLRCTVKYEKLAWASGAKLVADMAN